MPLQKKWCTDLPLIYPQDTTTTPKSIIGTSVKNVFNAQLTKCGSTHDTRLYSYVECCRRKGVLCHLWSEGFIGEDGIDGLEFSMSGCLCEVGSIKRRD